MVAKESGVLPLLSGLSGLTSFKQLSLPGDGRGYSFGAGLLQLQDFMVLQTRECSLRSQGSWKQLVPLVAGLVAVAQ